MAGAITHSIVATLPDEPGKEVNKGEWNAPHVQSGAGILGNTVGAGPTGVLSGADVLAFAGAEASGAAAAAIVTHVGLADPHIQYQKETEKDAASGYAGLDGSTKLNGAQQKYGALANTACEGNDARLSDSRAPNGAASGDLAGTYPSPTVTQARGIRETAGPTTLVVGAVADGEFLRRVGATVVGASPGAGSTDIKATTVTVATPALEASFTVTDAGVSTSSQISLGWGNCAQTDANHPGMGQVGFNAVPGTGNFLAELYSLDASKLFGAYKLNYLAG